MITEDYVSFETAKLLKGKGFDERACNTCYKLNGKFCNNRKSMSGVDNMICYQAPTLQMAMKWLREKYNLEIYPYHDFSSKWWVEIIKCPNSVSEYESGKDEEFDTYEEACESAIKYCLENLI